MLCKLFLNLKIERMCFDFHLVITNVSSDDVHVVTDTFSAFIYLVN